MDAGWGGTIFNIISYDANEWTESPGPLIELGEADGIVFLLETPGDAQYDDNNESLAKEYQDMHEDIDAIAASFKPLPPMLAGYVTITGGTLYLDEVEMVWPENKRRISELGLDPEYDFPNGYYINYLGKETAAYTITDETVFTWIDVDLLFVDDPDGNRQYSTNKSEEYLRHFKNYEDDVPLNRRIPLFVQVSNGTVLAVEEWFLLTI